MCTCVCLVCVNLGFSVLYIIFSDHTDVCVSVCAVDKNNVPSALFVALVSHPHVLWVSVFVSRRLRKELNRVLCVCMCVLWCICKPI